MKRILYHSIFFLSLIACKQTSGTSNATTNNPPDQQIDSDTLPSPAETAAENPLSPSETSTEKLNIRPIAEENTSDVGKAKDQAPPVQPVTKTCNPNFTKLSSPVRNHHIFYVSDFQHGEFKCWKYLEEHGVKICDGNSCIVYYVDSPQVKIEPGKPDYMSPETLKISGIGRFEYNGKYWEIKGASMWKRKGNGYGYYNSTNH